MYYYFFLNMVPLLSLCISDGRFGNKKRIKMAYILLKPIIRGKRNAIIKFDGYLKQDWRDFWILSYLGGRMFF